MNLNCVELLQREFPGKTVEEYRRQLGSFGVSGDLALQTVASLSGGQKSRVAFAKMCMAKPNFLILDEPTNHLDIETIEALGKAINKFTVIEKIFCLRYNHLNSYILGRRHIGFTRRKTDKNDLQRAVGLREWNCQEY